MKNHSPFTCIGDNSGNATEFLSISDDSMTLNEISIGLNDSLVDVLLLFESKRALTCCLIGEMSGLTIPSESKGLAMSGLFFLVESGLEVIWVVCNVFRISF